MEQGKEKLSENIIVVDCSFLDNLAADFRKNFSSMLGREIPKADLCYWLDCLMLDAGYEPDSERQTFVAFIHRSADNELKNFSPSSFSKELSQAFRDNMGEFLLESYPIENLTDRSEMVCESMKMALDAKDVKKVIVIADTQSYGDKLTKYIEEDKSGKQIKVFSMNKLGLVKADEDIIGYSLLPALGIKSSEL